MKILLKKNVLIWIHYMFAKVRWTLGRGSCCGAKFITQMLAPERESKLDVYISAPSLTEFVRIIRLSSLFHIIVPYMSTQQVNLTSKSMLSEKGRRASASLHSSTIHCGHLDTSHLIILTMGLWNKEGEGEGQQQKHIMLIDARSLFLERYLCFQSRSISGSQSSNFPSCPITQEN